MDGEVQRLIQEYRQAKEAWELRKKHTQASQGERLDPFCTYYKRNYVGFEPFATENTPENRSFNEEADGQCNSPLFSEVDSGCSTGISVAPLPVQSAHINIVTTSPQADLGSAQGEVYHSSFDTEVRARGDTLDSAGDFKACGWHLATLAAQESQVEPEGLTTVVVGGGVGVGTAASRGSEAGNSAYMSGNKVVASSSYSQDRESPNERDAHPPCDRGSLGQSEELSDSDDSNTPRLSEGSAVQPELGNGGDAQNAKQHSKWWRWLRMS